MDDGPEQLPQAEDATVRTILDLLPRGKQFDLLVTHAPAGEYTRHLRHEETGKAVAGLWRSGAIGAEELWTFAYEDGGGQYLPRPDRNARIFLDLPGASLREKYRIMTEIYGFSTTDWEAMTTPSSEAFNRFALPRSEETRRSERIKA